MKSVELVITYKTFKYKDIYAKENHYPKMAAQGYTKKDEVKNADGTLTVTYYK